LHVAASVKNVDIASKLLEIGVDSNITNIKNKNGQTPLHIAFNTGSVKMVKILVEAGANPDYYDNNGRTPLLSALYTNRKHVGKELIDLSVRLRAQQCQKAFKKGS